MSLTIAPTLALCADLFLMIWSATVLMPMAALAKNFPEDVQEALTPRLETLEKGPQGRYATIRLLGLNGSRMRS